MEPTTNGHSPAAAATATDVMTALRSTSHPPLTLWGFGSLAVGIVLFALMLWLAPSVAPEHVIERPAPTVSTTVP